MKILNIIQMITTFGFCTYQDIVHKCRTIVSFKGLFAKQYLYRNDIIFFLVYIIFAYANLYFDYFSNHIIFVPVSGYSYSGQILAIPNSGEKNLTDTYELFLDDGFPYPLQSVADIVYPPAIVHDGIVIANDSFTEPLSFNEVSNTANMNLSIHNTKYDIPFYTITGDTLDSTDSFVTDSINYTDRFLSLNFGQILKEPESNQISLRFDIKGENSSYSLIFVHGRLYQEGWSNNTLFHKVNSNSSVLIDLFEIVNLKNDKFSYLDRISINIEKDTILDWLPFRIDLGKSTINTPDLLSQHERYFVIGHIFQSPHIQYDYHYVLKNWEFKQILNQSFILNLSNPYSIQTNGWNILSVHETNQNESGLRYIKVLSERSIPLTLLSPFESIPNLDFLKSISSFGSSKDLLFISIMILMILLFYPRIT